MLDTNASIYQLAGILDLPIGRGIFAVSVVTKIELLAFPGLTAESEAEVRRMLA